MHKALAMTLALAALLVVGSTERASSMTLKVGDQVPSFKLPYATKDTINLDGFSSEEMKGKRYLLAFYPADWSGGCTREVCSFRDAIAEFEALNIEVLPVSADLVYSHHEWAKHHNLPFKLLADQTRDFGKQMGVYNEEKGMFKRAVFVVGEDGRFEYVDEDYSVKDDRDFAALKAFLHEKSGARK